MLLGKVTVKFYGKQAASVEYETTVSDEEQKETDLLMLFALYYAKMLYNLNRGEPADRLICYVQEAVEDVMGEDGINRAKILASGLELVEPRGEGITKMYSGELFGKPDQTRIIQTYMNAGGEEYYAPASVVIFLQYLIFNLPEGLLVFLASVLRGMDEYFSAVGDYSKMRSINKAPNYGINYANQILS